MPSIRLGRYEVKEYELPPVCAKCGAKAVASPAKTFSWHPPWIIVLIFAGLLIYVIVAVILTKRMTVPLPLCQRHRNYWRNRALFMYGGLIGLALLGGGGVVLVGLLDKGGDDNAFGVVCVGGVLLFLVWLIAAAIVQATSIRPKEITDKSITLSGLSEDFVDAVREDLREQRDEGDEDDRPRGKRRAAEDDEGYSDREPRRRREQADEDGGGYYDPEAKRRRRDDDEDDR